MTNKKLTSVAKGTASNDAVTKNQLDTKLSLSGGLMTGNLDMNSNRIYNVAQPDGDNQPATKIWSENKFLDKSSGVMAGPLNMSNNNQAIRRSTGNAFFVQITNPYVYHQFNMVKNKIINLGDPTDATDAVNKQYLEKSHVKPSHYNNEFKYLMTNRLAWTDLELNNIDSFDITKIDNLMPQDGNYHASIQPQSSIYNHYKR